MAFGVSDIVRLSNQARDQLGSKELKSNYSLMNAAQMKAEDMAKLRYFAHTAPDGTVAWDYFKKVNYNYQIGGENLAITNENADAVIDGWLNSPTHRDNLLNKEYTDFGIGMAYFGDYQGHSDTYVIVAFYASPASIQDVAATTNPAGISTALKTSLNVPPAALAGAAAILMIGGAFLEFRHIARLHRQSQNA
jgi:hypothetical protein